MQVAARVTRPLGRFLHKSGRRSYRRLSYTARSPVKVARASSHMVESVQHRSEMPGQLEDSRAGQREGTVSRELHADWFWQVRHWCRTPGALRVELQQPRTRLSRNSNDVDWLALQALQTELGLFLGCLEPAQFQEASCS